MFVGGWLFWYCCLILLVVGCRMLDIVGGWMWLVVVGCLVGFLVGFLVGWLLVLVAVVVVVVVIVGCLRVGQASVDANVETFWLLLYFKGALLGDNFSWTDMAGLNISMFNLVHTSSFMVHFPSRSLSQSTEVFIMNHPLDNFHRTIPD